MLRRLGLLLPLVLVLFTSGCTQVCDIVPIPGVCGGGGTTVFANDVIVIKSLEALPAKVSPGQQIKLQSYVENVGNENVDMVTVDLYDHCGQLFKVTVDCEGQPKTDETKCELNLLPKQTKSVSWTLVSDPNTKLLTECDLKINANYEYETDSVSSITFIDYKEYQKQLDDGTFRPVTSYITEGYGPIKPYLIVEDPQPIPVDEGKGGTVTLSFQLKNRGSGFLSDKNNMVPYDWGDDKNIFMTATVIGNNYNIVTSATGTTKTNENIYGGIKPCLDAHFNDAGTDKGFKMIDKESPKIFCSIPLPDNNVNLPLQSTIHVTMTVKYDYEFRKDIKVTVEPKV